MERFQLQSEPRTGAGKGVSRKLRGGGRLPAVLYGRTETPLGISLAEVDVRNILRKHAESPLVDLTIGTGTPVNAIIRDVQRHPASGKLLHIDLQRIRLDEKLRVEVHVEIRGLPLGVKDQGGILEHGLRSVNVLCLPNDIPDSILVDVSALKIHDSVRIRDIAAAYPNIEFLEDEDTTLATVIAPTVEAVVAAPVEAAVAEPELIRKPGAEDAVDEKEGTKEGKKEGKKE